MAEIPLVQGRTAEPRRLQPEAKANHAPARGGGGGGNNGWGPFARIIQASDSDAVAKHLTNGSDELRRLRANSSLVKSDGLVDLLFGEQAETYVPDEVFGRLRWGGLFVYASRDQHDAWSLHD